MGKLHFLPSFEMPLQRKVDVLIEILRYKKNSFFSWNNFLFDQVQFFIPYLPCFCVIIFFLFWWSLVCVLWEHFCEMSIFLVIEHLNNLFANTSFSLFAHFLFQITGVTTTTLPNLPIVLSGSRTGRESCELGIITHAENAAEATQHEALWFVTWIMNVVLRKRSSARSAWGDSAENGISSSTWSVCIPAKCPRNMLKMSNEISRAIYPKDFSQITDIL